MTRRGAMNTHKLTAAILALLAAALCLWCTLRGAAQGRDAKMPAQGRDASLPAQGPSATPRPPRTPKRPRWKRAVGQGRRPVSRFVTLTVVSMPYCNVAVDGEPEEEGTDAQGRLSIPMEPGEYIVSVSNPGYRTLPKTVMVRAEPPYRQEERFDLERALRSLHVKTEPPGVKVILDGSKEGESDAAGRLVFEDVDLGIEHTLRATKEDYREQTFVVPAHIKKEVPVKLVRDVLTLKVKTYPSHVEVFFDGDDYKGTSDADGVLLIAKVKTESAHTLRASKEGYVTQTATVPPNYELAVIKLPPVETAPAPPVGQSSPGAQGGRTATEAQSDASARDGDERVNPIAERPQSVATPPESVTPPAPQAKEEERPPSPQRSEPPQPAAAPPDVVELTFWNSVKDSRNPEEFAAYLRKYPQGQFAELAKIRMDALRANTKPEPEPTPTPTPTPTSPPSVTTHIPAPGSAVSSAEGLEGGRVAYLGKYSRLVSLRGRASSPWAVVCRREDRFGLRRYWPASLCSM